MPNPCCTGTLSEQNPFQWRMGRRSRRWVSTSYTLDIFSTSPLLSLSLNPNPQVSTLPPIFHLSDLSLSNFSFDYCKQHWMMPIRSQRLLSNYTMMVLDSILVALRLHLHYKVFLFLSISSCFMEFLFVLHREEKVNSEEVMAMIKDPLSGVFPGTVDLESASSTPGIYSKILCSLDASFFS